MEGRALEQLVAMGFERRSASRVLDACNGELNAALLVLTGEQSGPRRAAWTVVPEPEPELEPEMLPVRSLFVTPCALVWV